MEKLKDIKKSAKWITLEEYPELDIMANSVVSVPAIEKLWEHFANEEDVYEYILKPDHQGESLLIETSHDFCKNHAGKRFSLSQIRNFEANGKGFIDGTQDFFTNFPTQGTNLNSVLFNCRHMLKRVRSFSMPMEQFSNYDLDEMIVEGPVMISNKEILRKNVYGDLGYYIFTDETIKYLYNRFDLYKNQSTTYGHSDIDISNKVYIRKSWLEQKDKQLYWMMSYRILDENLWFDVKNKIIRGFSVELTGM